MLQVVVGGGRMKFNKMEMAVLAGQPGHRSSTPQSLPQISQGQKQGSRSALIFAYPDKSFFQCEYGFRCFLNMDPDPALKTLFKITF